MSDVKVNGGVQINAGSNGIEVKVDHNGTHADSSSHTVNQNNQHNASDHSKAGGHHTAHSNYSNANNSPLAREVEAFGQQVRDKIARQHDSPNNTSQSLSTSTKNVNLSQANDLAEHAALSKFERHPADHSERLTASIVEYLRDGKEVGRLTPETRKVLDAAMTQLGNETIKDIVGKSDKNFAKLLEQILAPTERSSNRNNNVFGGTATRASLSNTDESRVLDELVSVLHLKKYFNALEQTGSDVVRRAETSALRFLSQQTENFGGRQRAAVELLCDLRSGAFVPAQESYTPFPLTGRARVVSEMIELMRTLDAIEHAAQAPGALRGQSHEGEAAVGIIAGRNAAVDAGADEMLASAMLEETLAEIIALPRRAGRLELARLIASLNGMLVGGDGKPLLVADHQALKLDQLLWSGAAGGLPGASLNADSFPTRLSPLLIYGFDAVYSLVGFDGRGLTPPRFAHVQVQVNSSESEWVFGQPPLSDGWLRAVIERLKDSLVPDHNLLGEKLEESLLEGCFHTVLLRGEVQDGAPVRESFKATNPLPGLTGNPAFA